MDFSDSVVWLGPLTFVLMGALLVLGAGTVSLSAEADAFEDVIAELDRRYSPEHQMVGSVWQGPGYHSTIRPGTRVHATRESLDYAHALLKRDGPGDAERAAQILRRVLSLQETDPEAGTFGIWPWLLEEPLEVMSPPDFNWADFCGARLLQILHDDGERLPEALVLDCRRGIERAAQAIRRRNVATSYTNIAIMGGVVCAAAGELLEDQKMLAYGRERLQRVVSHTQHHGGFSEYNSPTYTRVALWECERALSLVKDPATRAAAQALRRVAWQTIAESFHPGTQQWSGPHSRAYADRIEPTLALYLTQQTGVKIAAHPTLSAPLLAELFLVPHLPCPEDLVSRFRQLRSDPLTIRRPFIQSDDPEDQRVGITWHTGEATLGSVNIGALWAQRRPLIGYWASEDDPAVVLRLRYLKDGVDFASIGVRNVQVGSRVLSHLFTYRKRGDWHLFLDHPKDGVFHAQDLRLRYELRGQGVAARALGDDRYELAAGNWRAVIHAPSCSFAGEPVQWELGESEGCVYLDGVCYHGSERAFDFTRLEDVTVGAGLELLRADQAPTDAAPELTQPNPGRVQATWDAANLADPMSVSGATSVLGARPPQQ